MADYGKVALSKIKKSEADIQSVTAQLAENDQKLSSTTKKLLEVHNSMSKSNLKYVTCWGDSITEGGSPGLSYPAVLQNLLTNKVTVTNYGVSSQMSGSISARQGGNVLKVSAFTIPSGTTAVDVAINVSTGNVKNLNNLMKCTIKGVEGTLVFNQTSTAKFTRTTAGSVVDVENNTEVISTQSIGQEGNLQIFWVGRNDMAWAWPYQISGPTQAIDAMVAKLSPQIKRFIVMSTTTTVDEYPGSNGYSWTLEVNQKLKEKYPYNFLDIRRYLIDKGLGDAGITPTQADITNVQKDTIPPSLLHDAVHPNETAKRLIAQQVYKFLDDKGWLV